MNETKEELEEKMSCLEEDLSELALTKKEL